MVADCLAQDCLVALASDEPDFEDGVVRAIAERSGFRLIVTNDATAFASSRIRAASTRDLSASHPGTGD